MADETEQAKERFDLASAHLDDVWPDRLTDPEKAYRAIGELNEATMALTTALNKQLYQSS